MISRRILVISHIFLLGLAAGCGGSDNGPQSERNNYGHSLTELQSAALSVTGATGTAMLKALGNETTASEINPPTWTVDPTGRVEFKSSGGSFYPIWYVAVVLTNADGNQVAKDWDVRTVWVLKGSDLVSSRTLYTQDGKLFVVSFPNPPFSFEGTRAVVELTRDGATELVSTAVVWNAK